MSMLDGWKIRSGKSGAWKVGFGSWLVATPTKLQTAGELASSHNEMNVIRGPQ